MSPQHQEIQERCLNTLRDAGLSKAIETVLPHFSYDGSTAVFVIWADGRKVDLVEGPKDELPALVLERVWKRNLFLRHAS